MASYAQALDRKISPIASLSERRGRLAVAVALYLAAGAVLAGVLGTWTDEEYTLATTAHGVLYAIRHAAGYELQAPLYFAALAFWRKAPFLLDSVWYARMFSVVCGAASLVAFAAIGRRIAPRTDPLWFALAAGLNPFAVWAALEIRHYALALLISALMWLAFDFGFVAESRRDARVAFVCLAIAGVYVQYFIAFAPVGYAVALLVLGKSRTFVAYLAYMAVVVLAVAPLAFAAGGKGSWFVSEAPSLGAIVRWTSIHPWLDFILPYDWQWPAEHFLRPAYTALAIAVAAIVVACRPLVTRRTLAAAAAAVTIELVYMLLAIELRMQLSDRYFVALYVPVVTAAYALWPALSAGRRPQGRAVFAATGLLSVAVLLSVYRPLAQPGDWKRVAAYLESHAHRPDAIAVYQPDAVPALLRQYHGDVAVVPYPRPVSAERYTIAAVSVASLADARAALAPLRGRRHIWFVEDGRCNEREPQFGCEYVERAIAGEFEIRSTQKFYGSRVDELSTPGAAAESAPQPKAQRGRYVVVTR